MPVVWKLPGLALTLKAGRREAPHEHFQDVHVEMVASGLL